jgi:predicted acetyltransferase
MTLALVDPSPIYRASFFQAEHEFAAAGGERIMDRFAELMADFPTYVQRLLDEQGQPPTVRGRVPASVLWLVEDAEYVGRVNLRHRLTARLRRLGGHIGYEIRPSRRRRGYAKRALALTLVRARGLGLRRVLLVCAEDNIGSRRVIEANGGRLQDVVSARGESLCRYWIDLSPASF